MSSISKINVEGISYDIKDNISGYIINTVDNLLNYYLKSETYNKNQIDQLINAITTINIQVVDIKPEVGQSNIIYLVPVLESAEDNYYEEFLYINNKWELIGTTKIDLSNYVTNEMLNNALADYVTSANLMQLLNDYALKSELPTKISQLENDSNFIDNTYHDETKQDKLTAGKNIKIEDDEEGNHIISVSGSEINKIYFTGTDINNERYVELDNIINKCLENNEPCIINLVNTERVGYTDIVYSNLDSLRIDKGASGIMFYSLKYVEYGKPKYLQLMVSGSYNSTENKWTTRSTNINSLTPTDFASKTYVDTTISTAIGNINTTLATLTTVEEVSE